MAATLTQERFTGPEWVFERKFDGIRLLAFRQGQDVRLLSRNRLRQNCPSVTQALRQLPVREIVVDGEITWGHDGASYHVFDLLWLDGRDLSLLPLDERHTLLQSMPLEKPLQRVARLSDERPWERACHEGWEGVIAKRRDSRYEHRRSPHWLKMKCETSQEFVVGGFTDPQGTRKGLGALLVGYFENDELVYAGKLGTGFDTNWSDTSRMTNWFTPASLGPGSIPSCFWNCERSSTPWKFRVRRSRRRSDSRVCARIGCSPRSLFKPASSSGRNLASYGIHDFSASEATRRRAR